jgi:hypothetical protein
LRQIDTFTKPASSCTNTLNAKFDDHTFVDLDRVTDECNGIIESLVKLETDGSKYRVPPLALTRFARGGKTATLVSIFNKLKEVGTLHPIMISFNGSGITPFEQFDEETQSQALLRLIAAQLTDFNEIDESNLVVDPEALDHHLGNNVVLLIDELNAIGTPDRDFAQLLRTMFLDRAGRYLVFTCHYPVSIAGIYQAVDFLGKSNDPSSQRGLLTVNMSLAPDLSSLRGMSIECEALTEESAAWLGYIPSLVYCTESYKGIHGIVTPSKRFIDSNIEVPLGRKEEVLKAFVEELLFRQRSNLVSEYYKAFATVDANLISPLLLL